MCSEVTHTLHGPLSIDSGAEIPPCHLYCSTAGQNAWDQITVVVWMLYDGGGLFLGRRKAPVWLLLLWDKGGAFSVSSPSSSSIGGKGLQVLIILVVTKMESCPSFADLLTLRECEMAL